MPFQVSEIATKDILDELKRRQTVEVDQYRTQIVEHKKAIRDLEVKLAFVAHPKRHRSALEA
jgi:hypothetical protein